MMININRYSFSTFKETFAKLRINLLDQILS